MGLVPLQEKIPGNLLSLLHVRTQQEGGPSQHNDRTSLETVHAGTFILDFQVSRTVRKQTNKPNFSYPVHGILLWQPA